MSNHPSLQSQKDPERARNAAHPYHASKNTTTKRPFTPSTWSGGQPSAEANVHLDSYWRHEKKLWLQADMNERIFEASVIPQQEGV